MYLLANFPLQFFVHLSPLCCNGRKFRKDCNEVMKPIHTETCISHLVPRNLHQQLKTIETACVGRMVCLECAFQLWQLHIFGEEFEQPKPGHVKASVHLFLRKPMLKLESIMHC